MRKVTYFLFLIITCSAQLTSATSTGRSIMVSLIPGKRTQFNQDIFIEILYSTLSDLKDEQEIFFEQVVNLNDIDIAYTMMKRITTMQEFLSDTFQEQISEVIDKYNIFTDSIVVGSCERIEGAYYVVLKLINIQQSRALNTAICKDEDLENSIIRAVRKLFHLYKKPLIRIKYKKFVEVNKRVKLNASESTSLNFMDLTFKWVQVGGPESNKLKTESKDTPELYLMGSKAGDYKLRLTVSDALVQTDTTITIKITNKPIAEVGSCEPRAVLLPPISSIFSAASMKDTFVVLTGRPVVLIGSGLDLDCETLTFTWKQLIGSKWAMLRREKGKENKDNPFFYRDVLKVIPAKEGLYSYQLVVNDGTLDSEPQVIRFKAIHPKHVEFTVASGCKFYFIRNDSLKDKVSGVSVSTKFFAQWFDRIDLVIKMEYFKSIHLTYVSEDRSVLNDVSEDRRRELLEFHMVNGSIGFRTERCVLGKRFFISGGAILSFIIGNPNHQFFYASPLGYMEIGNIMDLFNRLSVYFSVEMLGSLTPERGLLVGPEIGFILFF